MGIVENVRYAEVDRESDRYRVQVLMDLDGGSKRDSFTGVDRLDDLLKLFAYYGNLDLGVRVDCEASLEDFSLLHEVGLGLGQAVKEALTASLNIERMGSAHGISGDAMVLVGIELHGESSLNFNVSFERENLGGVATQNISEFFRTFAFASGCTLHIHKVAGQNDMKVAEATFKAFGLALAHAVSRNEHHRETRSHSRR